jgi:hypothetical protein
VSVGRGEPFVFVLLVVVAMGCGPLLRLRDLPAIVRQPPVWQPGQRQTF